MIGFLVDNLDTAVIKLQENGVTFKKLPYDGQMRWLAFAYDPDNCWAELIQRGGIQM